MDGTLADTVPICLAAFRSAFEKVQGGQYTDQEILALFGPTEEGTCQRMVSYKWRACLKLYLEQYVRLHTSLTEPFSGIRTALRLLSERRIALAVVTGKGPQSARISLRRLGLEPYFSLIETGSSAGPIKPLGLRRVISEWRVEPHQVAYIGDSAYDMQAASEVGLMAIGAAWSETSTVHEADPEKVKMIFSSVDNFTQWINNNAQYLDS